MPFIPKRKERAIQRHKHEPEGETARLFAGLHPAGSEDEDRGSASEDEAHPFIQAPQGLLSPHPEIVLAIDARHTRHRLFGLRELLDPSILAPH